MSWLLGAEWPDGDERGLRDLARCWRSAGDELDERCEGFASAAHGARVFFSGPAAEAFTEFTDTFVDTEPAYLRRLSEQCHGLARACDNGAMHIEYAKYMFIAEGLQAVAEWIWGMKWFGATAGASAAQAQASIAVRRTRWQILLGALKRAIIIGVAQNAGMEAGVQLFQMMKGTRDGWDWRGTLRAAESGALNGAFSLGFVLSVSKIPGLGFAEGRGWLPKLGNFTRNTVGEGLAGFSSTVAGSALHGEPIRLREALMEGTAGAFGGATEFNQHSQYEPSTAYGSQPVGDVDETLYGYPGPADGPDDLAEDRTEPLGGQGRPPDPPVPHERPEAMPERRTPDGQAAHPDVTTDTQAPDEQAARSDVTTDTRDRQAARPDAVPDPQAHDEQAAPDNNRPAEPATHQAPETTDESRGDLGSAPDRPIGERHVADGRVPGVENLSVEEARAVFDRQVQPFLEHQEQVTGVAWTDRQTVTVSTHADELTYRLVTGDVPGDQLGATSWRRGADAPGPPGSPDNPFLVRLAPRVAPDQAGRLLVTEFNHGLEERRAHDLGHGKGGLIRRLRARLSDPRRDPALVQHDFLSYLWHQAETREERRQLRQEIEELADHLGRKAPPPPWDGPARAAEPTPAGRPPARATEQVPLQQIEDELVTAANEQRGVFWRAAIQLHHLSSAHRQAGSAARTRSLDAVSAGDRASADLERAVAEAHDRAASDFSDAFEAARRAWQATRDLVDALEAGRPTSIVAFSDAESRFRHALDGAVSAPRLPGRGGDPTDAFVRLRQNAAVLTTTSGSLHQAAMSAINDGWISSGRELGAASTAASRSARHQQRLADSLEGPRRLDDPAAQQVTAMADTFGEHLHQLLTDALAPEGRVDELHQRLTDRAAANEDARSQAGERAASLIGVQAELENQAQRLRREADDLRAAGEGILEQAGVAGTHSDPGAAVRRDKLVDAAQILAERASDRRREADESLAEAGRAAEALRAYDEAILADDALLALEAARRLDAEFRPRPADATDAGTPADLVAQIDALTRALDDRIQEAWAAEDPAIGEASAQLATLARQARSAFEIALAIPDPHADEIAQAWHCAYQDAVATVAAIPVGEPREAAPGVVYEALGGTTPAGPLPGLRVLTVRVNELLESHGSPRRYTPDELDHAIRLQFRQIIDGGAVLRLPAQDGVEIRIDLNAADLMVAVDPGKRLSQLLEIHAMRGGFAADTSEVWSRRHDIAPDSDLLVDLLRAIPAERAQRAAEVIAALWPGMKITAGAWFGQSTTRTSGVALGAQLAIVEDLLRETGTMVLGAGSWTVQARTWDPAGPGEWSAAETVAAPSGEPLRLWVPDSYTEPASESTAPAPADPATAFPDAQVATLSRVDELIDGIAGELGLTPDQNAYPEVRNRVAESLFTRLGAVATGGIQLTVEIDGRTAIIDLSAVEPDDRQDALRVGRTFDMHTMEDWRNGESSVSTTRETQAAKGVLAGLGQAEEADAGEYGYERGGPRRDAWRATSTAYRTGIDRFVGQTQAYRVRLALSATVGWAGAPASGPIEVESAALLRIKEREAHPAGFPCDVDAVSGVGDDGSVRLRDDPEPLPGEMPERLADRRGIAVGVARFDPQELAAFRDRVVARLREEGLLAGVEPDGEPVAGSPIQNQNAAAVDKALSATWLDAFYDEVVQNGVIIDLTDPGPAHGNVTVLIRATPGEVRSAVVDGAIRVINYDYWGRIDQATVTETARSRHGVTGDARIAGDYGTGAGHNATMEREAGDSQARMNAEKTWWRAQDSVGTAAFDRDHTLTAEIIYDGSGARPGASAVVGSRIMIPEDHLDDAHGAGFTMPAGRLDEAAVALVDPGRRRDDPTGTVLDAVAELARVHPGSPAYSRMATWWSGRHLKGDRGWLFHGEPREATEGVTATARMGESRLVGVTHTEVGNVPYVTQTVAQIAAAGVTKRTEVTGTGDDDAAVGGARSLRTGTSGDTWTSHGQDNWDMHVGNQYVFVGDLETTVTNGEAQITVDGEVEYSLPEHEALAAYARGEIELPLATVSDALSRWREHRLALDRTDATELVRDYLVRAYQDQTSAAHSGTELVDRLGEMFRGIDPSTPPGGRLLQMIAEARQFGPEAVVAPQFTDRVAGAAVDRLDLYGPAEGPVTLRDEAMDMLERLDPDLAAGLRDQIGADLSDESVQIAFEDVIGGVHTIDYTHGDRHVVIRIHGHFDGPGTHEGIRGGFASWDQGYAGTGLTCGRNESTTSDRIAGGSLGGSFSGTVSSVTGQRESQAADDFTVGTRGDFNGAEPRVRRPVTVHIDVEVEAGRERQETLGRPLSGTVDLTLPSGTAAPASKAPRQAGVPAAHDPLQVSLDAEAKVRDVRAAGLVPVAYQALVDAVGERRARALRPQLERRLATTAVRNLFHQMNGEHGHVVTTLTVAPGHTVEIRVRASITEPRIVVGDRQIITAQIDRQTITHDQGTARRSQVSASAGTLGYTLRLDTGSGESRTQTHAVLRDVQPYEIADKKTLQARADFDIILTETRKGRTAEPVRHPGAVTGSIVLEVGDVAIKRMMDLAEAGGAANPWLSSGRRDAQPLAVEVDEDPAQPYRQINRARVLARDRQRSVELTVHAPDGTSRHYFATPDGRLDADGDGGFAAELARVPVELADHAHRHGQDLRILFEATLSQPGTFADKIRAELHRRAVPDQPAPDPGWPLPRIDDPQQSTAAPTVASPGLPGPIRDPAARPLTQDDLSLGEIFDTLSPQRERLVAVLGVEVAFRPVHDRHGEIVGLTVHVRSETLGDLDFHLLDPRRAVPLDARNLAETTLTDLEVRMAPRMLGVQPDGTPGVVDSTFVHEIAESMHQIAAERQGSERGVRGRRLDACAEARRAELRLRSLQYRDAGSDAVRDFCRRDIELIRRDLGERLGETPPPPPWESPAAPDVTRRADPARPGGRHVPDGRHPVAPDLSVPEARAVFDRDIRPYLTHDERVTGVAWDSGGRTLTLTVDGGEPTFRLGIGEVPDDRLGETSWQRGTDPPGSPDNPFEVRLAPRVAPDQVARLLITELNHGLEERQAYDARQEHGIIRRVWDRLAHRETDPGRVQHDYLAYRWHEAETRSERREIRQEIEELADDLGRKAPSPPWKSTAEARALPDQAVDVRRAVAARLDTFRLAAEDLSELHRAYLRHSEAAYEAAVGNGDPATTADALLEAATTTGAAARAALEAADIARDLLAALDAGRPVTTFDLATAALRYRQALEAALATDEPAVFLHRAEALRGLAAEHIQAGRMEHADRLGGAADAADQLAHVHRTRRDAVRLGREATGQFAELISGLEQSQTRLLHPDLAPMTPSTEDTVADLYRRRVALQDGYRELLIAYEAMELTSSAPSLAGEVAATYRDAAGQLARIVVGGLGPAQLPVALEALEHGRDLWRRAASPDSMAFLEGPAGVIDGFAARLADITRATEALMHAATEDPGRFGEREIELLTTLPQLDRGVLAAQLVTQAYEMVRPETAGEALVSVLSGLGERAESLEARLVELVAEGRTAQRDAEQAREAAVRRLVRITLGHESLDGLSDVMIPDGDGVIRRFADDLVVLREACAEADEAIDLHARELRQQESEIRARADRLREHAQRLRRHPEFDPQPDMQNEAELSDATAEDLERVARSLRSARETYARSGPVGLGESLDAVRDALELAGHQMGDGVGRPPVRGAAAQLSSEAARLRDAESTHLELAADAREQKTKAAAEARTATHERSDRFAASRRAEAIRTWRERFNTAARHRRMASRYRTAAELAHDAAGAFETVLDADDPVAALHEAEQARQEFLGALADTVPNPELLKAAHLAGEAPLPGVAALAERINEMIEARDRGGAGVALDPGALEPQLRAHIRGLLSGDGAVIHLRPGTPREVEIQVRLRPQDIRENPHPEQEHSETIAGRMPQGGRHTSVTARRSRGISGSSWLPVTGRAGTTKDVTGSSGRWVQTGAVEDNRGESLLFEGNAVWDVRLRGADETGWDSWEQVTAGEEMSFWLAHTYVEPRPADLDVVQGGEWAATAFPDHTVQGTEGYADFADEVVREFRLKGNARRDAIRIITAELPGSRDAINAPQGLIRPVTKGGRVVGYLQIKTQVEPAGPESVMGRASALLYLERLRIAFSSAQGSRSHGQQAGGGIGYSYASGDMTWSRSAALSAGGTAVHPMVARFVGPQHDYRLECVNTATFHPVNPNPRSPRSPVVWETSGRFGIPAEAASRYGLPVEDSVLRKDADGTPIIRGSLLVDAVPAGHIGEWPEWLGEMRGAGPATVRGMEKATRMRAEVLEALADRGLIPEIDADGNLRRSRRSALSWRSQLSNLQEAWEQLSPENLEGNYDLATQEGIQFDLKVEHAGRGPVHSLVRVRLERLGRPEYLGLNPSERVVNLDIGSDGAGARYGLRRGFTPGGKSPVLSPSRGWERGAEIAVGDTVNRVAMTESTGPAAEFSAMHRVVVDITTRPLTSRSRTTVLYDSDRAGEPLEARLLIPADILPRAEGRELRENEKGADEHGLAQILERGVVAHLDLGDVAAVGGAVEGGVARQHLEIFADVRNLIAHPWHLAGTPYRTSAAIDQGRRFLAPRREHMSIISSIDPDSLEVVAASADVITGDILLALQSQAATAASARSFSPGLPDRFGSFNRSRGTTQTDQQIHGRESLGIELGVHYLLKGDVATTVQPGTGYANVDRAARSAPEQTLHGQAAVWLPEREALRLYGVHDIGLPHDLVADAVLRLSTGDLSLDSRMALPVIRRAHQDGLLDGAVLRRLREELRMDPLGNLPPPTEMALADHVRTTMGSSIRYGELRRDGARVTPVEAIEDAARQVGGEVVDRSPELLRALDADFAGKAWWGKVDAMAMKAGFSKGYPVAGGEVRVTARADLGTTGTSLGNVYDYGQIDQLYTYDQTESFQVTGRTFGGLTRGRWQGEGTLGTDRSLDQHAGQSEQLTQIQRSARFTGAETRVLQDIDIALEVEFIPAGKPGRSVTVDLSGQLERDIAAGMAVPADRTLAPVEGPTHPGREVTLPGRWRPIRVEVEGLAQEAAWAVADFAEGLGRSNRNTKEQSPSLVADVANAALGGEGPLRNLVRMSRPGGWRAMRLPISRSECLDVYVEATMSDPELVAGTMGDTEIGRVNRWQHTSAVGLSRGRLGPPGRGVTDGSTGVTFGEQTGEDTTTISGVRPEESVFERGDAVIGGMSVDYAMRVEHTRIGRDHVEHVRGVSAPTVVAGGRTDILMFESDWLRMVEAAGIPLSDVRRHGWPRHERPDEADYHGGSHSAIGT